MNRLRLVFLPLLFWSSAFALELVLRAFLGGWSARAVFFSAVFALVWGLIGLVLSLLPRLAARITATSLSLVLGVVFIVQFALIQIRDLPASLTQAGMLQSEVGPVLDAFWQELGQNWLAVSAFGLVVVLTILAIWLFRFAQVRLKNWWRGLLFALGAVGLVTGIILLALNLFGRAFASPYYYYFQSSDIRAQVRELGLLATETIDIRQTLLGFEPTVTAVADPMQHRPAASQYSAQTKFDLMALAKNQPAAIRKISTALAATSPSLTNQDTGVFAGKNLIFIMAESLSTVGIDEQLTPTLYQLTHQGYVFDNFYSPYILSTIGGEIQAHTGLLPTQSLLKTWRAETPDFPLAIGHSFSRVGYDAKSSYTLTESGYYDRHKTRPTLGFSDNLACGSGMDALIGYGQCAEWIQSDTQLVKVALPFLQEKAAARDANGARIPFATLMLTMSGHGEYNYWNEVTARHRNAVNKLPFSSPARVYLASQIEFDRAVAQLIEGLRASGELENTVLVIAGDHYPYMLEREEVNELSDYQRDATFEIHRNDLIIWHPAMTEARHVTKVGSTVDILPTLLNLWGLPFDSRLMVGRDLLDESSNGLAIFADRSWVSDYGRYTAATKQFTPRELVDAPAILPDNYVQLMNQLIASRFDLSESIVQNDYYSYLNF